MKHTLFPKTGIGGHFIFFSLGGPENGASYDLGTKHARRRIPNLQHINRPLSLLAHLPSNNGSKYGIRIAMGGHSVGKEVLHTGTQFAKVCVDIKRYLKRL